MLRKSSARGTSTSYSGAHRPASSHHLGRSDLVNGLSATLPGGARWYDDPRWSRYRWELTDGDGPPALAAVGTRLRKGGA